VALAGIVGWRDDNQLLWLAVAAAVIAAGNGLLMELAIRRADERGSAPEREAAPLRRSGLALAAIVAVMLAVVPALGYAIGGTETAAGLFVCGGLYAALLARARRRARG
jgi:hypothetical protein